MIIQIRGTSGSGKSVAMRTVKDSISGWEPKFIEGRKRPLYYRSGGIVLMGHYEVDCGGCDTLGSAPVIYNYISTVLKSDPGISVVLSEGLLWSGDVKWTLQLRQSGQVIKPLFLTTLTETCIEWVAKRQAGREPIDPERVRVNLTRRVKEIEGARLRLIEAGIECRRCSASQAPRIILGWIKC